MILPLMILITRSIQLKLNKAMKAKYEISQFYADIPVGTEGTEVKSWTCPKGNSWVKLFFGRNLSGQKLMKSFPSDVLKRIS